MTSLAPSHHSHSHPHAPSGAAMLDRMASRQAATEKKPPRNASTHAVPATSAAEPERPDWEAYTCEYLITRILRQQHVQIREELLRLSELAKAVAEPARALAGVLVGLAADLNTQITEEEGMFSRLLDLELAYVGMEHTSGAPQRVSGGLHHALHEHHLHDKHLRQLRTEAARLGAADRELMERLLHFHHVLAEHFQLENEVLLPRASRMEKELFN